MVSMVLTLCDPTCKARVRDMLTRSDNTAQPRIIVQLVHAIAYSRNFVSTSEATLFECLLTHLGFPPRDSPPIIPLISILNYNPTGLFDIFLQLAFFVQMIIPIERLYIFNIVTTVVLLHDPRH